MDNKFDVRFCKCGTIHFVDINLRHDVCLDKDGNITGRKIIHVCLQCGSAIVQGLDDHGMEDFGDGLGERRCYDCYGYDLAESIDGVKSEEYHCILSKGVRLMMESGRYANWECSGVYVDTEGFEAQLGTTSMSDIQGMGFQGGGNIPFRDVRAINVNMNVLLREITPEQAESMCGYTIKSFNWIGTPYEKHFHH